MRTSSRLPALWSSRRLIGTPSSSECSPGGTLAGRLAPGLWFALWIGLGVGLGAGLLTGCRAGLGGVDENTLPPDLAMLPPPPPPCQAGRLRCSADRDATEMCDGMAWKRAQACDLAGGESCVEGVCKKACELVTRGNVGAAVATAVVSAVFVVVTYVAAVHGVVSSLVVAPKSSTRSTPAPAPGLPGSLRRPCLRSLRQRSQLSTLHASPQRDRHR